MDSWDCCSRKPQQNLSTKYPLPVLDLKKPNSKEVDWKKVRKQFFINKSVTFLNNGTLGLCPNPVMDAVHATMFRVNSTGKYGGVEKATRKALANLMNASYSEIALTHNVSEGINILAWSLPLKKGDEIILTDNEHVGNAFPWINRARMEGLVIKRLVIGRESEETLNNLKQLISKRTRVIAVPHLPCTTGTILPIQEICSLAKSRNIYSIIDGAHGPGMLNLDVKKFGCDAYASCGHKWLLGPKGTGFFYVNKDLISELEVYFAAGHSGASWSIDERGYEIGEYPEDAHRFYYGTQSDAQYAGLKAAVDFHTQIGITEVQKQIRRLNQHAFERIQELGNKVEILTSKNPLSRGGLLSFKLRDKDNGAISGHARNKHFIVRYVPESGLNCLRVSTHIYNTKEQIDSFINFLKTEA